MEISFLSFSPLYLLHGSPSSEYDWVKGGNATQSADTLIGYGAILPLIIAFPDGNGRGGETSKWGKIADQQQLMENFVAFDLVHSIDRKYRTIPHSIHPISTVLAQIAYDSEDPWVAVGNFLHDLLMRQDQYAFDASRFTRHNCSSVFSSSRNSSWLWSVFCSSSSRTSSVNA